MQKYGMPSRPSDVGVKQTDEVLSEYYEILKTCSAIKEGGPEATAKMREALEYLNERS